MRSSEYGCAVASNGRPGNRGAAPFWKAVRSGRNPLVPQAASEAASVTWCSLSTPDPAAKKVSLVRGGAALPLGPRARSAGPRQDLPSQDSPQKWTDTLPALVKLAREQPILYAFLETCAERGLSADQLERLLEKRAIVPMLPPLIQTSGSPPAQTPYEQPVQHPLAQSPLSRAKAGPSPGIPAGAAKAAPPGPGQAGQPAVPTGPHPIVAAPPQSPLVGVAKPAKRYDTLHAGEGKGPQMSFNQFVAQRGFAPPPQSFPGSQYQAAQ
jgi:hypothetical protein